MTINKNIFKIIIDQSALIRWKNKVKNINKEYHHIYLYEGDITLNDNQKICRCNDSEDDDSLLCLYQYRSSRIDGDVNHHKIIKCNKCDGIYNETIEVCKLPKNYCYTSCLDSIEGYKACHYWYFRKN